VRGVQLRPQRGGARLVTGRVDLDLRAAGLEVRGRFARGAADLRLPRIAADRILAVDGSLEIVGADRAQLDLDEVVAGYGIGTPASIAVRGRSAAGQLRVDVARDEPARAGRVAIRTDGIGLAPLAALAPAWVELGHASVAGSLDLAYGPDGVGLDLAARVAGGVLRHARVAPEPVPVELELELTLDAEPLADGYRIRIAQARAHREVLTVEVAGQVELEGGVPRRGELAVAIPEVSCIGALQALPEPLRRRLAGIDARGVIAGVAQLAFAREAPELTELSIDVDAVRCEVTREADRADPLALTRAFELPRADGSRGLLDPASRQFARLAATPRHVYGAFVAAEDGRFFLHPGFDPHQIERSLAIDLAAGQLVRGGSTITQQVAKNAFLDHGRTFARKLEEAVITWRLEALLSKEQILEIYLNLVELGKGVFGVPAAARHWFGTTTSRLSPREAAFLAMLTPAPRTYSQRIRERGGVDDELSARIDLVLRAMRAAGYLSGHDYRKALREQLELEPAALARDE
jgi:hypothetical protein